MKGYIEIAHEGEFPDGRGGKYKITPEFLLALKKSVEERKTPLVWDIGHALATNDNISLTIDEAKKAGLVHGFTTRLRVARNKQGKMALFASYPSFSAEARAIMKKKPYPSIAFVMKQTPVLHSVSLVTNPNIDLPKISESVTILNSKPITNMEMTEDFKALAILAKMFDKQVADVMNDVDAFLEYANSNAELIAEYVRELESASENAKKKSPEKMNTVDDEAVKNALASIDAQAEVFVNSSAFESAIANASAERRKALKTQAKREFVASVIESMREKEKDEQMTANAYASAMSVVLNARVPSVNDFVNSNDFVANANDKKTYASEMAELYKKIYKRNSNN